MTTAFFIFKVYHTVLAIIGCSCNSLLIYAALTQSPKAIRTYAALIVNFASTDLLECALDYFIQPRLIPFDITLTFILNGPCGFFGPTTCYVAISFYTHCISHSVWSLLLSFCYRYYILHHPKIERKKLLIVLFLIYIPSLLQGLTYWSDFVSREVILPGVQKSYPNYNFSQETGILTGVIDITSITAAYAILHMSFPILPVYMVIFYLRRQIISHLTARKESMSKETRAVHAQLLKVLTIQAIIPVFTFMAAIVYFLAQLGVIRHPIMEYMICGFVLILPSVSPIIYLFYVRPYRLFCHRIWLKLTCNKEDLYAKKDSNRFGSKLSTSKLTSTIGPASISQLTE